MRRARITFVGFIVVLALFWLPSRTEAVVLNVCGAITIATEEYANNPNYTGAYELEGRQILQGWRMWTELVNAKGGIVTNTNTYTINLTAINYGDGAPARVRNTYRGLD